MGTDVRIWAPAAETLAIVTGGRTVPARRGEGGWWVGPALAHGDDYAVSVNGGPPRPDPRSRWQPSGVHGASRWFDPASLGVVEPFRQVPLTDAIIYELHIGTFSAAGTFEGAIPHLAHLTALGVTHVELMPVAQFAGIHGWGYDGVDLFAPHAAYGGPHGLRALIRACHERGLAVLIDVVHNHFGPEGGYQGELGPYRTERYKTPWGDAVNLDAEHSAEVRRYLIDSALLWLRDYGADGLRLDAIHSLFDDSERHFLAELSSDVAALALELGRPLVLIGEYDEHDPKAVTPRDQRGWGLDAHWNDDFHHAVHALVTGETGSYFQDFAAPGTLAKVLERGYALDGGYSPFRKREHGKPYGSLRRDRLVAYLQSHDQVGNRAAGERLSHLCGVPRAKVAAGLLFASPFVPMIFQGEEWAASTPFCFFADPSDEALRAAIRAGREAEHGAVGGVTGPDPVDPRTRDQCVLRWEEVHEGEHATMLAWYRWLIATRRSIHAMRTGEPASTRVREHEQLIIIERGPVTVVCNFRASSVKLEATGTLLHASADLHGERELPPNSCALYRRA